MPLPPQWCQASRASGRKLSEVLSCGCTGSALVSAELDKHHPDVLQDLEHLRVPRTIPGLVTQRVLIMTFLPGEQITHLQVPRLPCCHFHVKVLECRMLCPSCSCPASVSGGGSAPAVVCADSASKVWSADPLLWSALKLYVGGAQALCQSCLEF